MPFSAAALNLALDAIGTAVDGIRLHSADPGASGTTAQEGTLQAPTWAAASGTEKALGADLAFTGLGASTAITHFSLWDGATFFGSGAITTGDQAANAAGEYTLTTGTVLDLD